MSNIPMGKLHRLPPHLVNEEARSADLTNTCHLHNISDQEFRKEMLQMFNKLKEMI